MPCLKCSNQKYRVGTGPCVFVTKSKCLKALAAIKIREERNTIDDKLKKHGKKCVR